MENKHNVDRNHVGYCYSAFCCWSGCCRICSNLGRQQGNFNFQEVKKGADTMIKNIIRLSFIGLFFVLCPSFALANYYIYEYIYIGTRSASHECGAHGSITYNSCTGDLIATTFTSQWDQGCPNYSYSMNILKKQYTNAGVFINSEIVVNGTVFEGITPTIIKEGGCGLVCEPPTIAIDNICQPCPPDKIYTPDPGRCETPLCSDGLVWNPNAQECTIPPNCDGEMADCRDFCLPQGKDFDFNCWEDVSGNVQSNCECIIPIAETLPDVIIPSAEDIPENPLPPAEVPHNEPDSNVPDSPYLAEINKNLERNAEIAGNNMDILRQGQINDNANADRLANAYKDGANKTNAALKDLSNQIGALDGLIPKSIELKGELKGDYTLPEGNIYSTEVDIVEEISLGEHISQFISSGLPVISTIRASRINASGSPHLSGNFFGSSFQADFSDYESWYHTCGLILVFMSIILAYRILIGS